MAEKPTRQSKTFRRESALLDALLSESSIERAASKAGLSESSVYRLLRQRGFSEKFLEAKRQIFSQSLGRLQRRAGDAVDCLLELLDPTKPDNIRLAAAVRVLEFGKTHLEFDDILYRIEKLESLFLKQRAGNGNESS